MHPAFAEVILTAKPPPARGSCLQSAAASLISCSRNSAISLCRGNDLHGQLAGAQGIFVVYSAAP